MKNLDQVLNDTLKDKKVYWDDKDDKGRQSGIIDCIIGGMAMIKQEDKNYNIGRAFGSLELGLYPNLMLAQ